MKVKNFNDYINTIIEFYKNYKTEDKQLQKLIVINLQNIKNRYNKEMLIENVNAGLRGAK